MSKTFASRINRGTEVYLGDGIGSTTLHLMIRDVGATVGKAGIYLPASDAPALALAILEAAGYSEESHGLMEYAVGNLRAEVERIELEDAEAEAQTKLEAEALELFKTLMGVKGYENFTWSEVASKDEWLAVARKARELGSK